MLVNKRFLVTQRREFMGPTLCEVLGSHGATVVTSEIPLDDPAAASSEVAKAGEIDILIANLAIAAPNTAATEVDDAEWRNVFAALVDPLPRLVKAALPAMV